MFSQAHHVTHVGGRSRYNKQGEINFIYWQNNEKKRRLHTNKTCEIFSQPWRPTDAQGCEARRAQDAFKPILQDSQKIIILFLSYKCLPSNPCVFNKENNKTYDSLRGDFTTFWAACVLSGWRMTNFLPGIQTEGQKCKKGS